MAQPQFLSTWITRQPEYSAAANNAATRRYRGMCDIIESIVACNERCDWCDGILHGRNSHNCSAETKIHNSAGKSVEASELLLRYRRYRAAWRRDHP